MTSLTLLARAPAPETLHPPVFCATLGERIHAVAVDSSGAGSRHLAISADGTVEPLAGLPVAVGGIAASGAQLIVTGWDLSRRPTLLIVEETGAVRVSAPIPFDGVPLLFPRPLAGPRGVDVVALSDPEQPRFWRARLTELAIGEPTVVPLAGRTIEADVASAPGGVALARVIDGPSRLDISHVAEGGAVSTVEVPLDSPLSPALAAVPGGLLLLALSRTTGAVELFGFDEKARPRGPSRRLASVAPARPRTGRLIPSSRLIAATWRTFAVNTSDGEGEPAEEMQGTVTLVDPAGETVAPPMPLAPIGSTRETGGWVGDRLLLIHGDGVPVVSAYQAS